MHQRPIGDGFDLVVAKILHLRQLAAEPHRMFCKSPSQASAVTYTNFNVRSKAMRRSRSAEPG